MPVDPDTLPVYPGEHPGTGFNDHPHLYILYKDRGHIIEACEICGKIRP